MSETRTFRDAVVRECLRSDCANTVNGRAKYCSRRCAMLDRPRAPLYERFWSKVIKGDGCWLWTGAHGPDGRGQIQVKSGDTRLTSATRVSWMLHYGPVPRELSVLHKCDNPPCVNPDHLFLGTAKDNIRDCILKGRFRHLVPRRGESNNNAKLTIDRAIQVRHAFAAGATVSALSRRFGIARSTVRSVVHGETWDGVGGPVAARRSKAEATREWNRQRAGKGEEASA